LLTRGFFEVLFTDEEGVKSAKKITTVEWSGLNLFFFRYISNFDTSVQGADVTTPLLEGCEDDTHTPEMGTWESTGIPKTSEFDCRGQTTLHWGVFYIIGKLSKHRC
jgi:hypothetical protein